MAGQPARPSSEGARPSKTRTARGGEILEMLIPLAKVYRSCELTTVPGTGCISSSEGEG